MSVVVGSLRVDLAMNSGQFAAGAQRAQTQIKGLEVATGQLQRASSSFNMRGLTQQLSQVGQQTMATGQFLQALAIQLPDIGLSFGAMGAAIGLVAGLALPTFAAAVLGASTETRTFDQILEAVELQIRSAKDAVDLLTQSSDELAERFGSVNDQVRAIIVAQGDLAIRKLADEASALRDALTGLYSGSGFFNVSQAEQLYRALDLAGDSSQRLSDQLIALKRAETLEDQIAIVTAIREEFEASVGPVAQMTSSQFEFYSYAVDTEGALIRTREAVEDVRDAQQEVVILTARALLEARGLNAEAALMSANFGGAASAAWGLVSALASGVQQAIALNSTMLALPMGGPGTFPVGSLPAAPEPPGRPQARPIDIDFGYAPATGGGSPGSGSSSAVDTAEDLRQAYDDLMGSLDPLVNAQQDLAEGTRIADEALAAGVISAEEHAAAIGKLGEEYADATNEGSVWTDTLSDGIEDLGDAFGDFMSSGMKDFDSFAKALVDTFSDAISKMVADAAASNLGQALGGFAGPIGGFLGSLVGGLFGGLFGGSSSVPYEQTDQYDIDQEKADLIRQMHELEGHSNYLKRQEIDAYDKSNQALAKKVQLLEEEAAIEAERQSLQMRLWELEGNTEAIRAAQLEALDESNRALQEEIWAQEDLAAATAEAEQAINDLVNSINPSDFATEFAYERAVALAKTGVVAPVDGGPIPAPVAGDPTATQAAETASLSAEVRTMSGRINELLKLAYGWDTDGLPTVAA